MLASVDWSNVSFSLGFEKRGEGQWVFRSEAEILTSLFRVRVLVLPVTAGAEIDASCPGPGPGRGEVVRAGRVGMRVGHTLTTASLNAQWNKVFC